MPQEPSRPRPGTRPPRLKAPASGTATERFALQAWVLIILLALLWSLLS